MKMNVFRREDGGWKVHAAAVEGRALTEALRPEKHGAVMVTLEAGAPAAEQAAVMNNAIRAELVRVRNDLLRGRSIEQAKPMAGVLELLRETGLVSPLEAIDDALLRLDFLEAPLRSEAPSLPMDLCADVPAPAEEAARDWLDRRDERRISMALGRPFRF